MDNGRQNRRKWMGLGFFCLFSVVCVEALAETKLSDKEKKHLIHRLSTSFWTEKKLNDVFSHEKIGKIQEIYSLNIRSPMALEDEKYRLLTNGDGLHRGREFQQKWSTTLTKAEKIYEVDRGMITSLLLVASELGRYTGNHRLLSVFVTIYLTTRHEIMDPKAKSEKSNRYSLFKKNRWALEELKSLLKLHQHQNLDMINLKGDYSGRFGICQLFPSIHLKWAVSSHRGKVPDLFRAEDAIYTIANVIRQLGYRSFASQNRKNKALSQLNTNPTFIRSVNAIAKLLTSTHLMGH